MGITRLDVSATLARDIDTAREAFDRSGDWRDYRRLARLLAEPVHNLYGRPNGVGVVPFLVAHPNLDDDSVSVANWRTVERELPDGPYGTAGVNHWATRCEYLAFPLTRANCEYLADCERALADYPVLDESDWSDVEHEQMLAEWDSYGEWETTRDLDDDLADALEDLSNAGPAGVAIFEDLWSRAHDAWSEHWSTDHGPSAEAADAIRAGVDAWHRLHAWAVTTCNGAQRELFGPDVA